MSGELRRPPQLWEQKVARTTSVIGLGLSSGDASAIVESTPIPGTDDGVEPAPSTPAPEDFIAPSTPTLAATVQGIVVTWDGENSNGDPYPAGSFVEVHVATTSATFTPDSTTLAGRILGAAGSFTISALTAGTTYYVRLVGVDEAGNVTTPSTGASSQTGVVQGAEISGDAVIDQIVAATAPATTYKLGSIWINTTLGTYNVLEDVAGTATWVKKEWDTDALAAEAITANQIAAQAIATRFLNGEVISTGSSPSARVVLSAADGIQVFRDATNLTFWAKPSGEVVFGSASVSTAGTTVVNGSSITTGTIDASTVSVTNLDADNITAGTLTGRQIRTASSGKRVEIQSSGASNGQIDFFNSSGTNRGSIFASADFITISAPNGAIVEGDLNGQLNTNLEWLGGAGFGSTNGLEYGLEVANADGSVYSYGIDENTTANAANVRVGANAKLLKSTSTVRLKDDLAPLDDNLTGVPAEKLSADPPSVDPYDVLTLTPTEFRSLSPADGSARSLGFIAEDVAAKFPWAANWDEDGLPSAIEDRPIIAALVAVIKDLTARIEALEA